MSIAAGTRLGPYEIVAMLGAGGMGEVYRARDTRLERIVAIKVLPAHLADNAELRERFEREARTIAGLNHPHICTLHDIGRQDGVDFLVMEYLEGETLAMRLMKGPLPIEQVLRYAIEISDALDKAHRNGVTHRDIKPGNIILTKSGTKLLDFGLAKLKQAAAPANASISQLPTLRDAPTVQGTILGTVQYMAPEQVEGKTDEIDPRTDIFAFGAVVYEMATGKKAFEGKTAASLMAKILEAEPPSMSSLQSFDSAQGKPTNLPALDRVVKRCLAKDKEERWQTAYDLWNDLKWIAESGTQAGAPQAIANANETRSRHGTAVLGLAAVGLLVFGALAAWNLKPSPAPAASPVSRTVINLPPGDLIAGLGQPAVALSPDGSRLAYIAIRNGTQQLYLRAMDSLEARPIAGTEGASGPFFSPDGQWLGFLAGGKLKKVSVNGGAALTLGDAALALTAGASWGSQGTIVFAQTAVAIIQQVSDAGGAPRPLTRLERGEASHRWPEFLPGGNAVLFTAGTAPGNWSNAQVAVHSVGTGERRNLFAGTQPRYALSGHLIYAQGGSLLAVPFDPQRLEVRGAAVPVVEGVLQSPISGAAHYSISSTGSLTYIQGNAQSAQHRMVWVSRNGIEQPIAAPAHAYQFPRLSPDGRRIAVAVAEQETQVWQYDLSRQTLTRLTFEGQTNSTATWTPDGNRIAFNSTKEGPTNIFWQLADGSGGLERLTTSENTQVPRSWSADGQLLAYMEVNPTTGYDIWVLRIGDPSAGSGQDPSASRLRGSGQAGQRREAQPFLRTPFNESIPAFSPDGRWLAYISDESGRYEIYVQPYPGPGGKWQISTDGGTEPAWNPNGRELFYRSGDKLMSVDIATQPGFAVGKPRVLFAGPYVPSPLTFPNYDVSRDGQRFLMLKPSGQAESAATEIKVVLNWFEELQRRVPTGGSGK